MPKESLGVWSGPDAVKDFLELKNHPSIPMIELPGELIPSSFSGLGVRIFAKRMDMSPLGNIKSIAVLYMLEDAANSGKLLGVKTLVESSSGNTGFSLAIYAKHVYGIENVTVIVPSDIAPGKEQMLTLAGADVLKFRKGKESGIQMARRMGEQDGWLCLGQYENEANVKAHREFTGREIWEQLGDKLTIFSAGMGTGGTAVGCHQMLKSQNESIVTVGVMCPADDDAVPGVRTRERLLETRFGWEALDVKTEVGSKAAYLASTKLCRNGLFVGPSSGFAYEGLVNALNFYYVSGELDKIRNFEREVVGVFICPDLPLPYIEKYSTHLSPADGF